MIGSSSLIPHACSYIHPCTNTNTHLVGSLGCYMPVVPTLRSTVSLRSAQTTERPPISKTKHGGGEC